MSEQRVLGYVDWEAIGNGKVGEERKQLMESNSQEVSQGFLLAIGETEEIHGDAREGGLEGS
jgi:hypothetical protein